jgi:hypothetical protein
LSVYRRISPYTTWRYTIVIRSHVNRRISPYTVVNDRACSTWVKTFPPYTELYDCCIRSCVNVHGRVRPRYASVSTSTPKISQYGDSRYLDLPRSKIRRKTWQDLLKSYPKPSSLNLTSIVVSNSCRLSFLI